MEIYIKGNDKSFVSLEGYEKITGLQRRGNHWLCIAQKKAHSWVVIYNGMETEEYEYISDAVLLKNGYVLIGERDDVVVEINNCKICVKDSYNGMQLLKLLEAWDLLK